MTEPKPTVATVSVEIRGVSDDVKQILLILRGNEGAENGGGLIMQTKLNTRFRRVWGKFYWLLVGAVILSYVKEFLFRG